MTLRTIARNIGRDFDRGVDLYDKPAVSAVKYGVEKGELGLFQRRYAEEWRMLGMMYELRGL